MGIRFLPGLPLAPLLLLAALPAAADSHQWSNLDRLRSGMRIEVIQTNGLRVEGKYQSYSDSAITFRTTSGEYSIERSRVVRVSTKPSHRRLRNILIGLGAGAAAGSAVWAGSKHGDDFYAVITPAPGLAVVGAVAGALVPTSLFTTVYRADTPSAPSGPSAGQWSRPVHPAPGVLASPANPE